MSSNKIFIDSNKFMIYSTQLAQKILQSNYKPDAIIGVSRGGSFPSIIIHEFLNYNNIDCEYFVISAKSYTDIEINGSIYIDISTNTMLSLKNKNKILIIDDVFDTGKTLMSIINKLTIQYNIWESKLKIATVFYKPDKNKTTIYPSYYVEITEDWIVFPHELVGLTDEEIKMK